MSNMFNWIVKWWWGGDPDIINSLSGLSKRDMYIIKCSWLKIYAKPQVNGQELFIRLFRKDPETQDYFKFVKGLSEEEIRSSHHFKAHVQNVMSAFDVAVANLYQPEVIAVLMTKLGTSHHKHRVKKFHFEEFKEIMITFLKEDLKLNDQTINSWKKFFDFIYELILNNLDD